MDGTFDYLGAEWQQFLAYVPRLVIALLVLVASYLAGRYLAKVVLLGLQKTAISQLHRSFISVTTLTVIVLFGVVIALNILGLERMAVSILAGGGMTAIIFGFAFREIGENFLAGLFLAFSRPFNVGDLIRTEDLEGIVKDIELRYTHIRADDGRDIYVPSSQLFNRPVTNYTRDGLRRFSFTVGIDYADDAEAATGLLTKEVRGVEGVLAEPACGSYIAALAPGYVEINIYYWIDMDRKDIGTEKIRTRVLDRCRRALLEGGYTVSSDTTANIAITEGGGDSE